MAYKATNVKQANWEKIAGLAAGQRVGVAWIFSACGACAHCQRGDEFIAGQRSHAYRTEGGGGAVVLLGINFQPGKIDYTPVWNQEVDLLGVNSHADEEEGVDIVCDLVDGKIYRAILDYAERVGASLAGNGEGEVAVDLERAGVGLEAAALADEAAGAGDLRLARSVPS